jgi:predicted metal-binding protein
VLSDLVKQAIDVGFSQAAALDPADLSVRDEVRAMCAADRCRSYNRSWSCPPACGTLDESRAALRRYRSGLLVQTTGTLDDPFDYETMTALGERQAKLVRHFRRHLSRHFGDVLTLGNGACALCKTCTYPSARCKHPDRRVTSMEAFGLVVTDVCRAAGLGYHYGPNTITYTGCYLLGLAP